MEAADAEIGGWVHARTLGGHIITGFVESVNIAEQLVLVRAHHACCEGLEGSVMWARANQCESAAEDKLTDVEGYILNMVDMALDTKDFHMFQKYSNELRKLKDIKNPQTLTVTVYL